jgi:hypothetical protein
MLPGDVILQSSGPGQQLGIVANAWRRVLTFGRVIRHVGGVYILFAGDQ